MFPIVLTGVTGVRVAIRSCSASGCRGTLRQAGLAAAVLSATRRAARRLGANVRSNVPADRMRDALQVAVDRSKITSAW
jgi:hypothetical protein